MRRFFVVLVLLVAGVVGLGFYLDWFRLSTDRTDQKTNITITVDQDKIRQDEEKAKEKVQEAGQKVKESTDRESDLVPATYLQEAAQQRADTSNPDPADDSLGRREPRSLAGLDIFHAEYLAQWTLDV